LDIPGPTGDKINVYQLENANAEDLASTLQTLAQGTREQAEGRTGRGSGSRCGAPPTTAAELFSGEVKISADKGDNSLVVIASSADYARW